jgi:hypothetical protein
MDHQQRPSLSLRIRVRPVRTRFGVSVISHYVQCSAQRAVEKKAASEHALRVHNCLFGHCKVDTSGKHTSLLLSSSSGFGCAGVAAFSLALYIQYINMILSVIDATVSSNIVACLGHVLLCRGVPGGTGKHCNCRSNKLYHKEGELDSLLLNKPHVEAQAGRVKKLILNFQN